MLEPGTTLDNGKYHIEAALGQGGFGHVYRSRELLTGETVAIKELVSGLAGEVQWEQRFIQEARATLRLTHPNIVRTHSIFREANTLYLVMEFLPGGSLTERLHSGPLSIDEAIHITEQLCAALDYAHHRGAVHCDIKPANVLFDAQGDARLADFGIAHITDQLLTQPVISATSTVMGTVRYMAPEQLEGIRDDPRVDIYALGALLYEMLCGRSYLDFETDTTPAAQVRNVQRIQSSQPRPLRSLRRSVPPALEDTVLKALAKDPKDRFATAKEFAHALPKQQPHAGPEVSPAPPIDPVREAAKRPPVPAKRLLLLGGAALTLLILIIVVIFLVTAPDTAVPTPDLSTPSTSLVEVTPTVQSPEATSTLAPLPTDPPSTTMPHTPTSEPQPTNTATATRAPTQAPTLTPTPVRPDAPKGDGFYRVGTEIAPGKWESTGKGSMCYWARLDDQQEILANHAGQAGGTITIRDSDYEVQFQDCGTWEHLKGIERPLQANAAEPKQDGLYTVGVEIVPGKWRSTGTSDFCYWARLDDQQEILGNHAGQAGGTVTIFESDYEVHFQGCGTWEYNEEAQPTQQTGLTETKGDGFYIVGTEIAPGKWESTGAGSTCFWERLDDKQNILRNHFGLASGTVTILESDYEVSFSGCGTWIYIESAERPMQTDARDPKGDGFYTVGVEIAPGKWRSTGTGSACFWERLDDHQDFIRNHFGQAGGTINILESDYEVHFVDCGTWEYLGP